MFIYTVHPSGFMGILSYMVWPDQPDTYSKVITTYLYLLTILYISLSLLFIVPIDFNLFNKLLSIYLYIYLPIYVYLNIYYLSILGNWLA